MLSHQRTIVYARRRTMLMAQQNDVEQYLAEFIGADETMRALITEKQASVGDVAFLETFRRIVLYVTDLLWTDHLETMDYLRTSVNLRAYGGREPLVEYQREGLRLFRDMESAFRSQVSDMIGTINVQAAQQTIRLPDQPVADPAILREIHMEALGNGLDTTITPTNTATNANSGGTKVEKVGRNEPCPCGSGKKYKNCHLNGN